MTQALCRSEMSHLIYCAQTQVTTYSYYFPFMVCALHDISLHCFKYTLSH